MEGTIIGWWKYIDGNVGEDPSTCYRLIIEYFDNGQVKKYETPDLNFNPKRTLGSNKCSIYLYNDEVYATDFIKARSPFSSIFRNIPPTKL